jgi:hypothetical protein
LKYLFNHYVSLHLLQPFFLTLFSSMRQIKWNSHFTFFAYLTLVFFVAYWSFIRTPLQSVDGRQTIRHCFFRQR